MSAAPDLQKGLYQRQLSMIAIGGFIGAGLFIGSSVALSTSGPGAFLTYGTAHRRLGVVPRWIRYVVLLAAAVTLAACSGGNAATGGGSNAGGGSTAKAHGPVEVALILKEFTNPYPWSSPRGTTCCSMAPAGRLPGSSSMKRGTWTFLTTSAWTV